MIATTTPQEELAIGAGETVLVVMGVILTIGAFILFTVILVRAIREERNTPKQEGGA